VVLDGYGYEPADIGAGDALHVTLAWRAQDFPAADYTVSLQLLDSDGRLVAQADRKPAANTRPTSSWQPGDLVVDRHGLPIPASLAPGRYTLQVVLYEWPGLERLRTIDGGEVFVLGNVVVNERE
jgi:hypothetical protein